MKTTLSLFLHKFLLCSVHSSVNSSVISRVIFRYLLSWRSQILIITMIRHPHVKLYHLKPQTHKHVEIMKVSGKLTNDISLESSWLENNRFWISLWSTFSCEIRTSQTSNLKYAAIMKLLDKLTYDTSLESSWLGNHRFWISPWVSGPVNIVSERWGMPSRWVSWKRTSERGYCRIILVARAIARVTAINCNILYYYRDSILFESAIWANWNAQRFRS